MSSTSPPTSSTSPPLPPPPPPPSSSSQPRDRGGQKQEEHAPSTIMPAKTSSCVVGIDVGGTNTDCVILQGDEVIAWHKTPTTPDIQTGIETAIEAVKKKAGLEAGRVDSVKIGTTQFINAIVSKDAKRLDKVAVIRLCGPYTRGTPPFADFPDKLRELVEGHHAYIDGGFEVDGKPTLPLSVNQLKEQAAIIKQKSIKSVVVIGVYSPSNATQEEEAAAILSSELGPGFDISCSSRVGRLGFIERENASILNASLRRFARHVIAGFIHAIKRLGKCRLYITLNDGTLSKASTATEYPVRCFASGPTNSARGAALLAQVDTMDKSDDREVIVVDIGGTTTDVCVLLKNGYPKQSAAYYKGAGVRTNFSIPDVHSLGLGGGSLVRHEADRTFVGSKSVGLKLVRKAIAFGGETLTATDLVFDNEYTQRKVTDEDRCRGLTEIKRMLEEAIDFAKTKQGDVRLILVGGGNIIIGTELAGVGEIIKPDYLEVANAVGAAVAKVSGTVDTTIVPTPGRKRKEEEKAATDAAIQKCVEAGGNSKTIEVVEVETVPMSYVNNQAYRLIVRVVGDLVEGFQETEDDPETLPGDVDISLVKDDFTSFQDSQDPNVTFNEPSNDVSVRDYLNAYRPRLEGDFWYLSETDLAFLNDGTGILGVGSTGEPYASYLACLLKLRNGEELKIRRQDTFPDDGVVLSPGFMGSPTVYQERIPGVTETVDAVNAVLSATGLKTFDAVVPNEIGGLNSIEALLAANRFGKSVLDTDLVARAYPMIYQTVRCLNGKLVTPSAVSTGKGYDRVFEHIEDNNETETQMRDACSELGSLVGMCTSPIYGVEARTLPKNSFSWAWQIGRSIALSRAQKLDPIVNLLKEQNGVLLFTGKIISVERRVGEGFTRGSVTLEAFSDSARVPAAKSVTTLRVDFENENLTALLKEEGKEDKLLAICPDLITFLDKANGAPLGVSDYRYGLRVNVIALKSPSVWTSEEGLKMGGPRAFDVDMDYQSASMGEYVPPKSVWELYGEGP